VTPDAKRRAVHLIRERPGLSERRACDIVGVARRVVRYEAVRPDDGALRQRLRELAEERRRFGYRRLGYLLAREGLAPNHKKLLRIYRKEGLKVHRRGGRKRALGIRAPMRVPQGPNQRWSLYFVSDAFVCGRRFRILAVVDDFSRECLALVADTSLSGARVARELTALLGERGKPLGGQRQRPMSGSSGGFWPADIQAPTTIGAVCNLSQMAPTVNGIAPCHSKHRIQRRRGGRGPHHP
jgi:putative transposase